MSPPLAWLVARLVALLLVLTSKTLLDLEARWQSTHESAYSYDRKELPYVEKTSKFT